MSLIYFLAANTCVLAASSLLAQRLWREEAPSLWSVLLGVVSLSIVIVHSVMLLCGVAGLLYPVAAPLGGLAALLIALALTRLSRSRGDVAEPARPSPCALPRMGLAAWYVTLVFGFNVADVLYTEVWSSSGTKNSWDDFSYHLVLSVNWLMYHNIKLPSYEDIHSFQVFYPSSGELIATWFMLPFGLSDRGHTLVWVGLTGFLYWGLFAVASAEILRRLKAPVAVQLIPALLLRTSTRFPFLSGSFADVDLGMAAILVAALAHTIPTPRDEEDSRGVLLETILAAALSGIAIGMKVTAVLGAVVIGVLCLARHGRLGIGRYSLTPLGGNARECGKVGLIFVTGWLATGAFWYLQNTLRTGNPLFPAKFLWWDGYLFSNTRLIEFAQVYGFKKTVVAALKHYTNWPFSYGALAGIGFLVTLATAWWWGSKRLTAAQRFWVAGSCAILGLTIAVFPGIPYSAGNPPYFAVGEIHMFNYRYISLVPMLGWIGLGWAMIAFLRRPSWRDQAAVIVTTLPVMSCSPGVPGVGPHMVFLASLIGSVAIVTACGRPRSLRAMWGESNRRPSPLMVGMALAMVLMTGLVLVRHEKKARLVEQGFNLDPQCGQVWERLDQFPTPLRVATFGIRLVFPLYGHAFQHHPVFTDSAGIIPSNDNYFIYDDVPGHSGRGLVHALRSSGVQAVLILRLPHPGIEFAWPTQKEALETSGLTELVYKDRYAALFRLKDEEKSDCVRSQGPRARSMAIGR